jgi:tetratricopeptide (TPR) repeat protein
VPAISAIFLVLSLVLAVVIGPQTRPWTWGPALLALGIATLAALPVIWKRGKAPADFGILALGALTTAWFAWRAWISPVAELGQADLLLVGGVVGAFVSVRAITGHEAAEKVLSWGIALLLLASVVVIGKQLMDPTYTPVFRTRSGERMISGFFSHYNYGANYLIASSMLVGAAALFGRHATATRVLWALIAIAGLAGVWFSRSRGGILGAAVACGVFAAVLLILGKRKNAKWFAPALIAVPVIGIGIAAFLFMGWQDAQELRRAGSGLDSLMDNNARLYFLGIAMSCIGLHPMTGGGSRSFTWECFRFLDGKAQGDIITHTPELVHNELAQAATDYGIIGAGLLMGLLGTLLLAAVLRVLFEENSKEGGYRDAWRLGALAAVAGMLVHSCFSFVFHLLPGILLLGICLGQVSRTAEQSPGPRILGNRILLTVAALSCAVLLLPVGWKGLQVTRILWPTYFSKQAATSTESRIDALSAAIRIWPQSEFYQDRATVFQTLAGSSEQPAFREYAERAIGDYQEASLLQPFDPGLAVNRANLLSQLQRDAEAEKTYEMAIALQGGMEPAYRGRFSFANHYLRKGLRLFDPANPEPARDALELAASQVETAVGQMHWMLPDMWEPRVSIHESLGTAREATNEPDAALESYNFAATLRGGTRAHYRAGVLIGKLAVEAWTQRNPSEALKLFIEARKRVGQAGNNLPEGVTPSQRIEYIDYLDRTIAFLKGAKVEPAK